MANEITDWKEKNCSLILRTADLSARETFSKEKQNECNCRTEKQMEGLPRVF